jgi:hypothetical protein
MVGDVIPPAANKVIDYTPDWHYRVWRYTAINVYEPATCDVDGWEDHMFSCHGNSQTGGVTGYIEVRENDPAYFADSYNFYDANKVLVIKSEDLISRNGIAPAGNYLQLGRYWIQYIDSKVPFNWQKVAWVRPVRNGVESSVYQKCPIGTGTPVAVDGNGDGVISRSGTPVRFDLNADGTAELLDNWFAPTEGILVDATIGGPLDGRALFGDQGGTYSDGYAKLARRDTDQDGRLTGAELHGLALWHDNGDAIAQPGELTNATQAGLTSIATSHSNYHSTATLNGATTATEDVWFNVIG